MEHILLVSNDGLFELVEEELTGRDGVAHTSLRVRSNGLAEKHVVEIRLFSVSFNVLLFRDVYVAHGMRGKADTLDETIEYAKVLESAVAFAHDVLFYVKTHGWFEEEN